jgi:hypothetical protein
VTTQATRWQLSGEYFENCNCDFLCPCLFSPAGPLADNPTEGNCDVMLAIHINSGRYGDTSLDGLNAVIAAHTPDGPMSTPGWKLGFYIDERANEDQRQAIGAILSGGEGGPMAAFAPLVGEILGIKYVPITFAMDGKRRSVEILQTVNMSVTAVPSMKPDGIVWAESGHPFAPDRLALAVGNADSVFSDYGMRWDNSGKNGHFAPINWSNS